jgi:hypothetical protein
MRRTTKVLRFGKKHGWEIAATVGSAAMIGAGLYTGGDVAMLIGKEAAAYATSIPGVKGALEYGAVAQEGVDWIAEGDGKLAYAARKVRSGLIRRGGKWTGGSGRVKYSDALVKYGIDGGFAAVEYLGDMHSRPEDSHPSTPKRPLARRFLGMRLRVSPRRPFRSRSKSRSISPGSKMRKKNN